MCRRGLVIPIVGVDPVTNRDVSHILRELERLHLIGSVGFLVNRVRRPQQRGSNPHQAGEQPLGEIQLHLHVAGRNIAHVRMRKSVIADGMAFVVNPFRQTGELIGLNAD